MTREEFDALVARLDPVARAHPKLYEWRVIGLALVGYAYLAAMVLFLALLLVGSVFILTKVAWLAIKIMIFVIPVIWVVLKSLWVRFPAPEGIEIHEEHAPQLFAMIHELRKELRSSRFDYVLITNELNAGVVQNPVFGLFGGHTNYLLIGLPLMKALTPDQLKAVLAHEFGHLSGGHGALSNRMYRLRIGWERLLQTLHQENHRGISLFKPFFERFAPYFNAYSFPLARINEYHADAVAAKLVGARNIAGALTATEVAAAHIGKEFWPGIHKQADTQPDPSNPFRVMSGSLSTAFTSGNATEIITEALKQETTTLNTHPSLADRLKALGMEPVSESLTPEQSADNLLGPTLERVTVLLDEEWQKQIAPSWTARHEDVKNKRAQLEVAADKLQQGEELSVEEAYQRAAALADVGEDPKAAEAEFQAIHARDPEHLPTCYQLALILLVRKDDAGIALLEKCMLADPDVELPGCERLYHYSVEMGRKDEAQKYEKQYIDRRNHLIEVQEEINTVMSDDDFTESDLSPAEREALLAELQGLTVLDEVYLLKRKLVYSPDAKHYVLGFTVKFSLLSSGEKRKKWALERLVKLNTLPDRTRIFPVDGDNAAFQKRFRNIEGARIL